MMGVPVYLCAAIPIIMTDAATFLPIFVVNIMLFMLVILVFASLLIIMVILRHGDAACEGDSECGHGQTSKDGFHGDSLRTSGSGDWECVRRFCS